MSRMPAKKSLKMLAPRMASPLTRPRYRLMRRPSMDGVVTTSICDLRLVRRCAGGPSTARGRARASRHLGLDLGQLAGRAGEPLEPRGGDDVVVLDPDADVLVPLHGPADLADHRAVLRR